MPENILSWSWLVFAEIFATPFSETLARGKSLRLLRHFEGFQVPYKQSACLGRSQAEPKTDPRWGGAPAVEGKSQAAFQWGGAAFRRAIQAPPQRRGLGVRCMAESA